MDLKSFIKKERCLMKVIFNKLKKPPLCKRLRNWIFGVEDFKEICVTLNCSTHYIIKRGIVVDVPDNVLAICRNAPDTWNYTYKTVKD